MAKRNVPAVAMDVFPEKAIWRGIKLDPGEVWVANHLALLEKGIPMIQFVTNLSQIGKNRFVMIAAPLKIKGGDASPARALALVE
jgi:kynurenine formamidase